MVGWLVFGPRGLIAPRDVGAFLVVPVGWLVYTLVRGAFVDWYPYPFVDVGEHGYGVVLLTCVVDLCADARAGVRRDAAGPPAVSPVGPGAAELALPATYHHALAVSDRHHSPGVAEIQHERRG